MENNLPLYRNPEYIRRADEIEGHLNAVDKLMQELREFKSVPNDIVTDKPRYEWRIVYNRPFFVQVRD